MLPVSRLFLPPLLMPFLFVAYALFDAERCESETAFVEKRAGKIHGAKCLPLFNQ
jgi:hypothetical protein